MESIQILSLDLDWFNYLPGKIVKDSVNQFFSVLPKICQLPEEFYVVPEHQYLYPWVVNLLEKKCRKQAEIFNIDQHHDFYYLDRIDFNNESALVTCGNFFAFMSHSSLLEKYTWITSSCTSFGRTSDRRDFFEHLSMASCPLVRQCKERTDVVNQKQWMKTLANRVFDGFIIVRSPKYLAFRKSVYNALRDSLDKNFAAHEIKHYNRCREFFPVSKVPEICSIFS